MMAVPKVPNEASDWRAIDIFVFTNGQQYSPPRKYHLSAQELNWWKAILSFLARSQYGSLHSTIDLYTIDGQKLDGPLQLINGTAYVAVRPPDHFIDTGYNKYLLKASRSWEKSQARRSNSIERTKPDELDVITTLSNSNINICNEKLKEEIVTDGIIDNTVVLDSNVIKRPNVPLNVHEYPQRDSSAIFKQDKKIVSLNQHSSILRKSATASPLRKDSIKSKDAPLRNSKGPLKINKKAPGGNEIVTKSKIPKRIVTHIAASKSEQVHAKETESPLILDYSNPNVLLNHIVEVEHDNEEQDSVFGSNIDKHTDSAIAPLMMQYSEKHVTDHDSDKKGLFNNINECNENEPKLSTVDNETVENTEAFQNNEITPRSPKDLDNQKKSNVSPLQRAPNVSFAKKPDSNNFLINNGDIVNLKLQIEVKNGDGTINKTCENGNKTEISLSENFKIEKGSQVNLDSEMTVQNKSFQSTFMSDFSENFGIHGNSGVIVIKCACYQENNYNISKINTKTSINDKRIYVILLPTPGIDNELERCQCGNNAIYFAVMDSPQTDRKQVITNPVKKATSTMALEVLTNTTYGSEDAFPPQSPTSVKNEIILQVDKCQKNVSETKQHVGICKKKDTNQRSIDKKYSKIKSNGNIDCGVINNNTKILAKATRISDKPTQTELISLLLEARRHEDGRYSFHLPPLNVLRYYRL